MPCQPSAYGPFQHKTGREGSQEVLKKVTSMYEWRVPPKACWAPCSFSCLQMLVSCEELSRTECYRRYFFRSRTPASSPLSPPTAQGPDTDTHIGLPRGSTSGLLVPRPWPEAYRHSLVGTHAQPCALPWWLPPYSCVHWLKAGRWPSQLESTAPSVPCQREGPERGHCPL